MRQDVVHVKGAVLMRNGQDCFAACMASLIGCELDEVPPFHDMTDDAWLQQAQIFASERGYLLTDYLIGGPPASIFIVKHPGSDPPTRHGHGIIGRFGEEVETLHDPGENWPDFDASAWAVEGYLLLLPKPQYVEDLESGLADRDRSIEALLEAEELDGDPSVEDRDR